MTRYQPRSLAPLPMSNPTNITFNEDGSVTVTAPVVTGSTPDRTLTVEAVPFPPMGPPGDHITFPEIEWPAASDAPPGTQQVRTSTPDWSAWDEMPIGMIESDLVRWSPWIFWILVALSFVIVLAKAGGWL